MISPLDLIKGYFSFTSYLPWVVMAIAVFSLFVFFKRKFTSDTNATTWKGYLMVFIIILLILSFIYLCFFKPLKESSSKYTGQLIGKIDEAIKKYDETINNYHGLKNDWEKELEKCEKELKDLYKQKEITQEYKDKIKEVLDNNETKIKELKAKLSENAKNIAILKGKLVKLEEEKEAKEKELQQKKEERKLASPDDKKRLQAEIDKLQEERIEIAKQIRQVNLAINNLKTNQEYYQDLLGRAEKLKKDLEQRIAELSADEKSIFNQIKSVEERRAEIQNEIAEVKKKQEEIQIQKDLYQALKLKYRDMHNRLITYEKENEASVGNIVRWGFKAFDKVTDLIPGKYGLKIIGKTATVTRKFAQGMAKTTLTLHEGHRLWHMYNEVANENKEHPPMITKETLEIYTKNIDDDLAKLDADYKDYEKILGDYKLKLDKDNLTKEVLNSEKQNQTVRKEIKSWVDEYSATSEELNLKLNEVLDTKDLNMKLDGLEEKLSIKTEELNVTKEELKQKNPIYARAQQRLQAQRGGKVPEMVMIPNK